MAAAVPDGQSTGSCRPGATPLVERRHPLHVFAARLHARLDELAGVEAWALDTDECGETVREVLEAEARLAGLRARLLAHAETVEVAAASSATSTAAWLRSQRRV